MSILMGAVILIAVVVFIAGSVAFAVYMGLMAMFHVSLKRALLFPVEMIFGILVVGALLEAFSMQPVLVSLGLVLSTGILVTLRRLQKPHFATLPSFRGQRALTSNQTISEQVFGNFSMVAPPVGAEMLAQPVSGSIMDMFDGPEPA
jgi:hypothetical protein